MLYDIILFLHIVGTVLIFATFGISLSALLTMLACKNFSEVRRLSHLAVKADGIFPIGTLLILIPGLYMTFTQWGWSHAWINLSLVLLIVLMVMGPIINLPRLKAIAYTADHASAETSFVTMQQTIKNKVLWLSIVTMTMITTAILYMMTIKPELLGSIVVTVLAFIAGPVIGKFLSRKTEKSLK